VTASRIPPRSRALSGILRQNRPSRSFFFLFPSQQVFRYVIFWASRAVKFTETLTKHREAPMSNMSYCRFRNTLNDFADCAENIGDDLSEDEHRSRVRLIVHCARLLVDLDLVPKETIAEAKAEAETLPQYETTR